ncbi:hypothetical protein VTN00DRAFT_9929 [Thermoascus crustaceus]|uniref:uncharacterized protein n=1 Tax=Thermoascus crustaceus TaxID=5088 RepID=UPI0037423182
MALGDTKDTKCKDCGKPLTNGWLSQQTKWCPECIALQRRLRALEAASSSSNNDNDNDNDYEEEGPAEDELAEKAPSPFTEPQQPRTESAAAGEDKNEGERGPAEEVMVQVEVKNKPVVPEEAGNNSDNKRKRGVAAKLTPACADCKKSKKRCVHRRPIDEVAPPKKRKRGAEEEGAVAQVGRDDKKENANDNNNDNGAVTAPQAAVGAEAQAPPPTKRARRLRWQDNISKAAGTPTESQSQPAASSTPTVQTRGSTRKRKLAESQEKESPVDSAAAAATTARSDAGVGGESSRKRPTRARKPTAEQQHVSGVAAAPVPASRAATTEYASAPAPAAAPGQRVPLPFPLDNTNNLKGSAIMSRHSVLSWELQTKIYDARAKWTAAMEALEAAKEAMDMWLELWRTGQ